MEHRDRGALAHPARPLKTKQRLGLPEAPCVSPTRATPGRYHRRGRMGSPRAKDQSMSGGADADLCRCGQPRITGKKKCTQCLARHADEQRRYRHRLSLEGRCHRCRESWAGAQTECPKCLLTTSSRFALANIRAADSGLCRACRRPRSIPSVFCEECLDKKIEKRLERAEFGLCTDCGEPSANGHIRCSKCEARSRGDGNGKKLDKSVYVREHETRRGTVVRAHWKGPT